jgi:hypothetical protein
MTKTHVGGSQPHWESVVLRLRRGITNELVRYLRKSDGCPSSEHLALMAA